MKFKPGIFQGSWVKIQLIGEEDPIEGFFIGMVHDIGEYYYVVMYFEDSKSVIYFSRDAVYWVSMVKKQKKDPFDELPKNVVKLFDI